ncbi:hypothetical protein QSI_4138 [Clostridioides difficile P28]|nr:hypothetical protein QSI_4138 [Clostridioides difficile P28]
MVENYDMYSCGRIVENLLHRDKQLISSASYYELELKAKFSTVNGVFC